VSVFTHLDSDGRARMVDVSAKAVTKRIAIAGARFSTTAEVIALVRADGLPKADVLPTARIAGIAGAKRTSDLIPLCHPLPLTSVTVDFDLGDTWIDIRTSAATTGQTGVEMEALTAAAVAGLTLHDMVKAVDPLASLCDLKLLEKSGGKRGNWTRENSGDKPVSAAEPAMLRRGSAAVLVASTASAAGTREDTTGPQIAQWLTNLGLVVDPVTVVSDAGVTDGLRDILSTSPALIITTGGTGVSPTDATPEATAALLDQPLPGVAEAIRARGIPTTPTAALSRGLAGVAGQTVIVNLPGSPGGVRDGLSVLQDLLPHLLEQVSGDARHGVAQ
jgi:cyclic pyranopterin phosphate synthase